MNRQLGVEYARQLDKEDGLSKYREEFYIKDGTIYMDGNSLGLLSKRAEQSLLQLMESWKEHAVDGWMKGEYPWFDLSENISGQIAPLVGALKGEVMVTGSTTVNLHQLTASFYSPSGNRSKILADELNFPSDLYALQSQIRLKGLDPDEHLLLVKSKDGRFLDEEDIISAMSGEVALIVLPAVLYRSGQILDLKRLTHEAHVRGIPIGFDLCHSIGAIPHELHEWGADFAFWCTYKYLNGGPGSTGGLFIHEKHFGKTPGLGGWFGSDKNKQFDMDLSPTYADDAGAFQIGTPNIFSMAPLLGSMEIFNEIGIDPIRQKSLKLTAYMMELIEEEMAGYFTIGNPRDESRGGHIFLEHPEAARICKALKEAGVIPDFRKPNGIRLAPAALYNSFEDVWEAVQRLKMIIRDESYKKYSNEREVIA